MEPLVYVGSLLLGIGCLGLSACWLVLELGNIVAKAHGEDYAKFDFMNGFLNWISPGDGDSRSFIIFLFVDLLFIVLTQYLVQCTTSGNNTIGYRFACFTFYAVT